ncbi:HNH endonuclease signature motif containing protein, partial [Glycomyces xiaoerkulensis]|uniref:HNH endonuclease signature motif containing protein n=1 Tax=Glycomyces xiaoerkulensis TaxID=2038139 RepID=UPI0012FFF180
MAATGTRSTRAEALRTDLDDAAALMNSVHAQVLGRVIEALDWKVHRDLDGFASPLEWLRTGFGFHFKVAADIAVVAKCARKFAVLAEAAAAERARIDLVAVAVRRLERTKALRVYARVPYGEAVPSPWGGDVTCSTPEHLIAEYCAHATRAELIGYLDRIEAALDAGEELLDGLSEQSLQRVDLVELPNGMWSLEGLLDGQTGRLFAKLLETAVPPPRADETDEDGVLPPAANRRAEALHQMIAAYGAGPAAPTRHGHTATLNLTVDLATLRGEDTGRVPLMEGRPVSVAKARLLACEAGVVPIVFDYTTGEAVEVGAYRRLPGASLRRKLEAEQQAGCAWVGCGRPVSWCEAHHLVEWWRGGPTTADNLILLCRFHHGRVHTPGWSVTKTGPG